MNEVYRSIGTTKQSFHQRMNRWLLRRELETWVLQIIRDVRKNHPRMAARKIFIKMKPKGIGLKRFTDIARKNGLMIQIKRNRRRTTNSNGVIRFPNLIASKELTAVNQVWVSDITYIEVGKSFYYLTIIMDDYSRRILGYSVSKRLKTEHTTIPALKQALRTRDQAHCGGRLIIHSDGGGQYYSKEFTKLTQQRGILNSMARIVYENPKAERVIETLKIEYLEYENIGSYQALKKAVYRTIKKYNHGRPHDSLNGATPVGYEQSLNGTKDLNDLDKNLKLLTRKTVNVF